MLKTRERENVVMRLSWPSRPPSLLGVHQAQQGLGQGCAEFSFATQLPIYTSDIDQYIRRFFQFFLLHSVCLTFTVAYLDIYTLHVFSTCLSFHDNVHRIKKIAKDLDEFILFLIMRHDFTSLMNINTAFLSVNKVVKFTFIDLINVNNDLKNVTNELLTVNEINRN